MEKFLSLLNQTPDNTQTTTIKITPLGYTIIGIVVGIVIFAIILSIIKKVKSKRNNNKKDDKIT